MAVSQNEIFTFTWRIENFSMCPLSLKQIESSTFVVGFLDNSKWKLQLSPREFEDENYMSLFLSKTEDLEKTSKVKYAFTVISCNPEKNVQTNNYCSDFTEELPSWGDSFSRDKILNRESELLKNDVLTVNCHMWKTLRKKGMQDIIVSRNANHVTLVNSSNVNERSSVTRINVESKSVLWAIKRFSEMHDEEAFVKTISSVKQGGPTFELTFYMKESPGKRKRDERIQNHRSHLDIRRINADNLSKSVFIRGQVKTLGAPKGIQYRGEGEHHFKGHGEDTIWEFPVFIQGKKIIEDRYLYYTDDVLYLHFNFAFSVERDASIFETHSSVNSICPSSNMYQYYHADLLQQLWKNGEFSDVSIRTGDRVFKVHKCVLGTRSPVFKAMFETDMKEKESGFVEITDLDAETVNRMITFMYTGILERVGDKDFASLYCAANKYDVLALKCRCRCALMSNLSVDTVAEALRLADLYQDEDLLEALRCYFEVSST